MFESKRVRALKLIARVFILNFQGNTMYFTCTFFLNEDFLGIVVLCGMTNLCSEKVCKWQAAAQRQQSCRQTKTCQT